MRKQYAKKDGYCAKDLLHYASDHLKVAEHLFKCDPLAYDSAGYLGHLGIELMLKAVLLDETSQFPNEHDLCKLSGEIHKVKKFSLSKRDLEKANGFTWIKYPTPSEPTEVGNEDWQCFERLKGAILGNMTKAMRSWFLNPDKTRKNGRKLMRKLISGKRDVYMIIEKFKNQDPVPVYRRFRERGRLAPEGLKYLSSWVSEDMRKCFQLMECEDADLIREWISHWSDLVDFEVVPVISSEQALKKIMPRR